jgi:hypothetical protein
VKRADDLALLGFGHGRRHLLREHRREARRRNAHERHQLQQRGEHAVFLLRHMPGHDRMHGIHHAAGKCHCQHHPAALPEKSHAMMRVGISGRRFNFFCAHEISFCRAN